MHLAAMCARHSAHKMKPKGCYELATHIIQLMQVGLSLLRIDDHAVRGTPD
jgi:hypothetical protein